MNAKIQTISQNNRQSLKIHKNNPITSNVSKMILILNVNRAKLQQQ